MRSLLALLLMAAPTLAQEPGLPSYQVHAAEPPVAVEPEVLRAFEEVLSLPEPGTGLYVTATPLRPRLLLLEGLSPHTLGLDRPPEEARFLAEVSTLAPAEELEPRTAGQLADRFYAEARRQARIAREEQELGRERCRIWGVCPNPPLVTSEVELWLARALPLYRRAAAGEVRHAERLALRLAWAAHLGGGDEADLELARELLDRGEEGEWSLEARLVLADAELRAPVFAPEILLELDPDGSGPLEGLVHYEQAWGWVREGELGRGIDGLKFSVVSEPAEPVMQASLKDLVRLFAYTGADVYGGSDHLVPRQDAVRLGWWYMAESYAQQGQVQHSMQMLRRLIAMGEPMSEIVEHFLALAPLFDARPRLSVLSDLLTREGECFEVGGEAEAWREPMGRELARAAAEVHYGSLGTLRPEEVEQLRRVYDKALDLDPEGEQVEAVRLLREQLR